MKTHNPLSSITKKILREFPRKKFLGDISISDTEFYILVDYLKAKYESYRRSKRSAIIDPVLCVSLVVSNLTLVLQPKKS